MQSDLAVTAEWVRERIRAKESLFFIEIKHAGDADLALNKVQGALKVTTDDAKRHLAEIPRGATVVVCSATPSDDPAWDLARYLVSEGVDAFVLTGGIRAYLVAGLPAEESGQVRDMTRLRGE